MYALHVERVDLLVLMSTHNREKELASCLTALYRSLTLSSFLVSLSNSGEAISVANDLGFEVVVTKVPIDVFWADAMYRASDLFRSHRKFTYVLWLNDDVTLFPRSIDHMMGFIRSGEADIVVGQTSSEDGQITYGGFLRESGFKPLHFNRIIAHDKPLNADTFNGNVVLLGPKALTNIGPFLPGYRHYLADIAYGLEATSIGLKTLIAPGFAGFCSPNNMVNPCLDKSVERKKRILDLNKPQGLPISPQFKFSIRYGRAMGILYFISTYLRFVITLMIYEKPRQSEKF